MKTGIDTIWEDRKRILGMPISMTKYYLSEIFPLMVLIALS